MTHRTRFATLIFCLFCLFIHPSPAAADHNNGEGRDDNPDTEEQGSDAGSGVTIGDIIAEAGDSAATVGNTSATTGDSAAIVGNTSATAGDVTNDLVIEATDLQPIADATIKVAKINRNHAERAPRSQPGTSAAVRSPCGDGTGLSIQTGSAGGGISSILEACRAYRVKLQNESDPKSWRTTLVNTQYYVGFPFRLVVHVVSGGILH